MINKMIFVLTVFLIFGCNRVDNNLTYKKLKISFDSVMVIPETCCNYSTFVLIDSNTKLKIKLSCYNNDNSEHMCSIPVIIK